MAQRCGVSNRVGQGRYASSSAAGKTVVGETDVSNSSMRVVAVDEWRHLRLGRDVDGYPAPDRPESPELARLLCSAEHFRRGRLFAFSRLTLRRELSQDAESLMPGACFGDVVRLFPMKNRHSNGRLTYMLNRHEKSRTIDIVHIPLRVHQRPGAKSVRP